LANFFVRVAAGQFELEKPEQLVKLLGTMARNKLLNVAQKYQAQRRDQRRVETDGAAALEAVTDPAGSPSRIVAGAGLVQPVRGQMSDDERYLAEQRGLGRDWAELAAELGSTPDALRKQLAGAGGPAAPR